jgi:hypothetical protein
MTDELPPVVELTLNPRWYTFMVNIDGHQHRVVRFMHPRHGQLDFHLTEESEHKLGMLLATPAARVPS